MIPCEVFGLVCAIASGAFLPALSVRTIGRPERQLNEKLMELSQRVPGDRRK